MDVSSSCVPSWSGVSRPQPSIRSRDSERRERNYVVGLAHSFSSVGTRAFVALYLLAHGVVKVALVTALFRRRRWAYPALILSLALFILYQAYRVVRHLSLGLALLTIFDVVIVWLVWRAYRRLRRAQR
jgi:uncharacterized membrane protein